MNINNNVIPKAGFAILNMDVHSISLKGKRPQNEDKHNVILNIEGKNENMSNANFFGVYDGHGGKYVSKFLEKYLPLYFMDKRISYPLTHNTINRIYARLNDILHNDDHKKYSTHCGSTCLIAIHYKTNNLNFINVINSGDSRCVLCRNNVAMPITKDHKPHWPEEKRRIEKLGGNIYFDGYDFRIKDLSVSRAFGDFDAHPYLTNVPDIFTHNLDKNDKFMVMACDGLWDVLTNSDVINFILNECYDNTLNTRIHKQTNIARKLAEYAILKGSTDNITILVIFF